MFLENILQRTYAFSCNIMDKAIRDVSMSVIMMGTGK